MEQENNNKESEEKSAKKKKKHYWLTYIFGGKILTEDFIIKQSKLFFLIFCLILIFISNRYYCSKKLTEMDSLKKEQARLQDQQTSLISRLTKISGESQIEELLKRKEIELTRENTTVYEIHK